MWEKSVEKVEGCVPTAWKTHDKERLGRVYTDSDARTMTPLSTTTFASRAPRALAVTRSAGTLGRAGVVRAEYVAFTSAITIPTHATTAPTVISTLLVLHELLPLLLLESDCAVSGTTGLS